MANHLAGKSHDVTLIILEDDSRPSFYDIDARIQQVHWMSPVHQKTDLWVF